MSFRRSRYFLGEAFRGLIRNRLMSMASILTVASCLLVVSVFYSLVSNIDFFLHQLEDRIGVVNVAIYNEVSAEGLQVILDELWQMEHVTAVSYISHEEAFEIVLAAFDDPSILYGFPPDAFPRSFLVEISDLRYHDIVAAHLQTLLHLGIEHVGAAQNIAHMTIAISNMISWVSWVLILILAVISIIIITNTIRITVNARHVEINIMKYVGATDWFIRWPFLIEGILIGIIGSLLPVALLWTGYSHAVQAIVGALPLIEVTFLPGTDVFAFLFPFVIGLGALIGAIGSLISVRRHLHV